MPTGDIFTEKDRARNWLKITKRSVKHTCIVKQYGSLKSRLPPTFRGLISQCGCLLQNLLAALSQLKISCYLIQLIFDLDYVCFALFDNVLMC